MKPNQKKSEKPKMCPNAVTVIVAYGEKQKEFTLVEQLESEYFPSINLEQMTLEFIKHDEKKDFPSLRLEKIVSAGNILTSFHGKDGNCIEPSYDWNLGYGLAVSKGDFHIVVYIKAIRFGQSEYDFDYWNKRVFVGEVAAWYLLYINRQKVSLRAVVGGKASEYNMSVSYNSIIDTKNGGRTDDTSMALDPEMRENFDILVDRISTGEGTVTLRQLIGEQKEYVLKKGETAVIDIPGHEVTEITFLDFLPSFTIHEWDL